MWSQISFGFDEDESTRNILDGSSHLFAVHTVATIASALEVAKSPKICCVSSKQYVALAVDSRIYIVNDSFSDLMFSLNLESYVDCMAFSPDSQLLLIGQSTGTIHVLHVPSKTKLWSRNLVRKQETEEQAFKSLLFISNDEDFMKICILTMQDQLYFFYNISCTDIYRAIEEGCLNTVLKEVQKEHVDIGTKYDGFVPYCMCENIADEDFPLCLAGQGAEFMSIKDEDFSCGFSLFNCTFPDVYIKKTYISRNGRYVIALDTECHLRTFCSITHLPIYEHETMYVLDFLVIENEDPNSLTGSSMNICALVKNCNESEPQQQFFQVLQFPTFTSVYSIPISEFAALASWERNQDCIYIVEGDVSGDIVNSIKVRAVAESSPEAKLSSLLGKRKFDQAEEFAVQHSLDLDLVYRTKMNMLIEELSSPRSQWVGFQGFVTELSDLLAKVKDVSFIKTCVNNLVLPSLDQTNEFLALCRQWLLENCTANEEKEFLLSKINQAHNRILTYEILSESKCVQGSWQEFLKGDLLAYFLHDVKHHNIHAAVILWQRHQDELALLLTPDKFEEILSAIPESVPSDYLIPFLKNNFFPVVFCSFQESMKIAADWLNQRVYLLEINEKENWPENGINWLQIFPYVLESLEASFPKGRISYTIHMASYYTYKKNINAETSIGCLFQLLQKLKELSLLQNDFGCKITLSDYCQDDKVDVFCLMLDRLQLSCLPKAISLVGKEIFVDSNLDLNSCLHSYIKNIVQQSPVTWWHWEAAPWEEKLLVVIQCIKDHNLWMDAAKDIIFKAPVPWSDGVQKLVDIGISIEHPMKEYLRSQLKLLGLKQVLKKYDMKDFLINHDIRLAEALSKRILKQEGVTALDDVLLIYQSYEGVTDYDAYFTSALYFLNNCLPYDMIKVLSSMPSESAALCSRLVEHAKSILNDSYFLERQEFCRSVAKAGVLMIDFLNSRKADVLDPNVKYHFHSIVKLQKESCKFVPYNLVSSDSFCWEMIHEAMDLVISGKSISNEIYVEKKIDAADLQCASVSQIFRLGDILDLEREEVMSHLVLKFIQHKQHNKAVDLCNELICSYKTAKTADTLITVAKHLISNFKHLEKLEFSAIVQTLQELVSHAATYCDKESLGVCICLWRHVLLLGAIDRLTLREFNALSVPSLGDRAYYKWRFSPLYSDEGFFVDSSYASMLFAEGYNNLLSIVMEEKNFDCIPYMGSVMNTGKGLISYLKQKGQEIAALRVISHTVFFLIPAVDHLKKTENSALVQVGDTIHSLLQDTFYPLFKRIVEQQNQDMPMLFGILSLLRSNSDIVGICKNLQNWCNKDVKQTLALYAVASKFLSMCGSVEMAQQFSNLHDKLVWFSKCSKTTISPEEISIFTYQDEKRLISKIISSQDIDHEAMLTCSTIFKVDQDDILLIYVKYLFCESVKKWSGMVTIPQEEMKKSLFSAEKIISKFDNQTLLLKNLKLMFQNGNSYYYEILLFLSQKICQMCIDIHPERVETWKNHTALLKFLLVYKRISQPSEIELNEWTTKNSLEPLPEISKICLPFHSLVNDKMRKIINPELRASTATVWLEISSILKMPSDELLMIAVKNTVSNYIAQESKFGGIALAPDENLLTMVRELLQKIKDPELAAATSICVSKMLPPGANQVLAAKCSVVLVERQMASSKDAKIQEMHRKTVAFSNNLAVELVLHKYNLADQKCLAMVHSPELLVQHLIKNYCVPVFRSVKVCKAIHEISDAVKMDPVKLYFSFLCKWLTPSQVVINNLDETLMDRGITNDQISSDIEDQKSLVKAICLGLGIPKLTVENLMSQILKKFVHLSKTHVARALCCAASVLDPEAVSSICSCDSASVHKNLILRTCMADLESLGLQMSSKMFVDSSKQEIVEKILTRFSHNPKALICCVKLCLEYEIWNASVWIIMLQKMKDLFMVDELHEILSVASSKLYHIWHTEAFIGAWNFLLSSVFLRGAGDATNEDIINNFYSLLLRCPCGSIVDLASLLEGIKELNLFSEDDLDKIHRISGLVTELNKYLSGSISAEAEDSSSNSSLLDSSF